MAASDQSSSMPSTKSTTTRPPDSAARKAGLFLLLTAAVTVVMVFTRVAAGADEPTLAESVRAIADSKETYAVSGVARLISGATLMVGAWFLLRTWIIRERHGTPLVPHLFVSSGLVTALSGAFAIALAVTMTGIAATTRLIADYDPVSGSTETLYYLRWITGKIGFTFAALALLVAARYQWKIGGTLRYVSPISALTGIAMLFIWVDAASVIHPIIGAAFFVWLVSVGTMLLTGRVERHFIDFQCG